MTSILLRFCGVIFVVLAGLGVLLPILPTTPFLLLAAGCFAKSSPYLHSKLLNSKIFGPMINDWQKYRTIPKNSKLISLLSMCLAGLWSCYIVDNIILKVFVVLIMLAPAIFVYRLPITKAK